MKYLKSITLICGLLLLLNGCGEAIDDAFSDEPELESLIGIISENIDSGVSGTHWLETDNGDVKFLRSVALNLSDPRYLGNRVEIAAVLNSDDDVFEVTKIKILEILENDNEEITFDLYKNTDLGFQLKYYTDWDVNGNMDSVAFTSPVYDENLNDKVIITQFVYNYNVNMEGGDSKSLLSAYLFAEYPELVSEEESLMHKVGPDQLDALKITDYDESGIVDYFVSRPGLIYRISFVPANTVSIRNEDIFYEMLLEFKFTGFTIDEGALDGDEPVFDEIDNGSASSIFNTLPILELDFNTFVSLPYSFEAKYPASWYYAGTSGSVSGVKHHYGFSDNESFSSENELISLDIISFPIPGGESLNIGDRTLVRVKKDDNVELYVSIDGQKYRFSGGRDYEEIMTIMAHSIKVMETEE